MKKDFHPLLMKLSKFSMHCYNVCGFRNYFVINILLLWK